MADDKKSNKPLYSIRAGAVSMSVFENKISGKDGKADFKVQSINLQRSYTKDEGKTFEHQDISFRKNDLVKLQVVLNKVLEQQFLNTKEVDNEA
jgi:hypothetical protein